MKKVKKVLFRPKKVYFFLKLKSKTVFFSYLITDSSPKTIFFHFFLSKFGFLIKFCCYFELEMNTGALEKKLFQISKKSGPQY